MNFYLKNSVVRSSKRSLSQIVTTIILILLILAAIGVIWGVYSGIIKKSSSQVEVGKFTVSLSIDPKSVSVNPDGSLTIKVKRNSGGGNLSGVGFIISNGTTSNYEEYKISLKELDEKWFTINQNGAIKIFNGTFNGTIAVVPVIKSSQDQKIFGERGEIYNSTTKSSSYFSASSGGGGGGSSSSGSSSGSGGGGCTPSKTCNDYPNQCGNALNDGCNNILDCSNACGTGFVCTTGMCQASTALQITINSPLAVTYSTSNIVFNVTTNKNVTSTLLTLNNGVTNYTMQNNNNFNFNYTLNLSNGNYNVVFYASNSTSMSSSSINFVVNISVITSTPSCDLTSAAWSTTSAVQGAVVQMNVQGNNCNGQLLNYSVYEDDGLFGSIFSGSYISTNLSLPWTAQWMCDGNVLGVCTWGNPEYYFTVTVVSNQSESITSNKQAELVTTAAVATCGNGIVETGEMCDDGNTLNNDSCSSSCQLTICGDGIVQRPNGNNINETCDSNSVSCTINGYSGTQSCSALCTSYNSCTTTQFCGDGIKNGLESCDDGALNGQPNKCNSLCTGITASVCGNNIIEGTEVCDGTALNGKTCVTQGFASGTLSCNSLCNAYDTSLCVAQVQTAGNIYISQSLQGSDTGNNCANSHSVAWFNTASNWNNLINGTDGKIGPGDSVHLCGTITNTLTMQSSGSSGSPVTILFENGAKLSKSAWGTDVSSGIYCTGKNYITIDGGNNGIIEATSDGSPSTTTPAGSFSIQQDSNGVYLTNCANWVIKNLNIGNLYQRAVGSDDSNGYGKSIFAIDSSSLLILNNTIHDDYYDIYTYASSGNTNGLNISGNNLTRHSTGIVVALASAVDYSSIDISNNKISGGYVWDGCWSSCTNWFHGDGIHTWGNFVGHHVGPINIYNNEIGPDLGTRTSGYIYLTDYTTPSLIYNNLIYATGANKPTDGFIYILNIDPTSISRIYSNTIKGLGNTNIGGNGMELNGVTADIKNNIINNVYVGIWLNSGGVTASSDYNNFFNYNSAGIVSGAFKSFSQWQVLGFDTHGVNADPKFVSSVTPFDLHLQSTSPAINKGTDLSAYFINDKDGVTRPVGGLWDIGAYER